MKKILIITTGGTIAMKRNSPFGVIPNNEFIEGLQSFPHLRELACIDFYEFSNIPSPYVTPELMLKLSRVAEEKLKDYDGIVITHGTDTLEETAYFLDLTVNSKKPIVFTAAMRSNSELGLDGPRNIIGAVRVASDDVSVNKGVLVVMNDTINPARDVVKTDSGKTDSFITPAYGLLGIVEPDRVIYYRDSYIKEKIFTNEIDTNIDLIKCVSGMDDRFILTSIEKGARAIVLEGFGRGNVPAKILPAIEKAMAKDILIVLSSRTYTGRVLAEYGYEGGGLYLEKMGVSLGGDLKGTKMRIKLMILFGKYKEHLQVRDYLRDNN